MRRRIGDDEGMQALGQVAEFFKGQSDCDFDVSADKRGDFLCATRFALEEIAERHPGRSVEIRVPYAGAVQAIAGTEHRRGTPPNVVEAEMPVFLALALGHTSWDKACETGSVQASGARADLSALFPLFTPAALERYRDGGQS